jgi:intraflagellar transport protein 81
MLQVLKSRAGDLDDFLKKMEDKQGISGYTVVQSEMEKISALKQRIDESKGKTLQEISRIVDDINSVRRAFRALELNAGP